MTSDGEATSAQQNHLDIHPHQTWIEKGTGKLVRVMKATNTDVTVKVLGGDKIEGHEWLKLTFDKFAKMFERWHEERRVG